MEKSGPTGVNRTKPEFQMCYYDIEQECARVLPVGGALFIGGEADAVQEGRVRRAGLVYPSLEVERGVPNAQVS